MNEQQQLSQLNQIDSDAVHIPLPAHLLICVAAVMATVLASESAFSILSLLLYPFAGAILAFSVYECRFYFNIAAFPLSAVASYLIYSSYLASSGCIITLSVFIMLVISRKQKLMRSHAVVLGTILTGAATLGYMAFSIYTSYGKIDQNVISTIISGIQSQTISTYTELGLDSTYAYKLWSYTLAIMPSVFIVYFLGQSYLSTVFCRCVRKLFSYPDDWKLTLSHISGIFYIIVFSLMLIFSFAGSDGIICGFINITIILTPGMFIAGIPFYKSSLRKNDGRINILLIIFTAGLFLFNVFALLIMIALFGAAGLIGEYAKSKISDSTSSQN